MNPIKKFKNIIKHLCNCNDKESNDINIKLTKSLDSLDSSFRVIAVRCNSEDSTGKRKLVSGRIYYFFKGYTIEGDTLTLKKERPSIDRIYDDYYTDLTGKPHIQICAIVGQNGSGKSSIIEFMLRLVNNFAAATIGELGSSPAADHLHYIDGVNGDMWYSLGGSIYRLGINDYHVTLAKFREDADRKTDTVEMYIEDAQSAIYDNHEQASTMTANQFFPALDGDQLKTIFSNLFYTFVSNYSIYAYNTNDYKDECNSKEKENSIENRIDNNVNAASIENRCWLHGLFHKNDGYLTPIVLTPYRYEGNININNENDLGREHLISLFIRQRSFRQINGHLSAEGVRYGIWTNRDYDYEWFRSSLDMKNITPKCYLKLQYFVIKYWGNAIGYDIDRHKYEGKRFYSNAIEYITYKTIKVSRLYIEHHDFYQKNQLVSDDFDIHELEELIKSESNDHSHITRKIFQAIAYLVYDVYNLKDRENTTNFDELNKRWTATKPLAMSETGIHLRNCALIPPPFMDSQILMRETVANRTIDFETLSSGEKQQMFSTGSLCYHLDNINSAHLDKSNQGRILYENVNVVLEEIELYYHPELQQQLVKFLLDRLQLLNLEHLKGINIMIVTHSPYVLSDIPRQNVLALKKNDLEVKENLPTFGANIHEMLKDSFFLQYGSQGYFAQWEIGHILACLEIYRENGQNALSLYNESINDNKIVYSFLKRYITNLHSRESGRFDFELFKKDLSKESLLERVHMIDEPIIQRILEDRFRETFNEEGVSNVPA